MAMTSSVLSLIAVWFIAVVAATTNDNSSLPSACLGPECNSSSSSGDSFPPFPGGGSGCPCGFVQPIYLLLYITPCYRYTGFTPLTTPRQCDVFVLTSMQAATDASVQTAEHLPHFANFCFSLFSHFHFVYPNRQEDLPVMIREMLDIPRSRLRPWQGIIGPSDPILSEIVNYVTERAIRRPTISYTTTDTLEADYPYFYSTTVSESFLNEVRLQLLYDFNWRRVAIVATEDPSSSETATDFLKLSRENTSMAVNYSGSFYDDPTIVLQQAKDDDYRIFMGFFPASKSRHVICKAIRMGLTTSHHVWILPGIYDYQWWSNCTCNTGELCTCSDCSTEEMREAVQSMIFIDVSNIELSYNETETTDQLQQFVNLFNNTIQQFRTDTYSDDDMQYLIHSRAPNAHDAVVVWSLAWYTAMERLIAASSDIDDTCQYLIYTPNDRHATSEDRLTELMRDVLDENVYCGMSGYYRFSRNKTYDFGQAKITQFQDDQECITGYYRNYIPPDPSHCPRRRFTPLDDALLLNSSQSLMFFEVNSSLLEAHNLSFVCRYRWKTENGSLSSSISPPTDGACYDESCECYDQLSVWGLSLAVLVVLLGLIAGTVLILVNFRLKLNKHLKASSPRFNYLIITGCMIMYLSILCLALSSTGNFIFKTEAIRQYTMETLCEFDKWLFYSGMAVILTTMLARNWRLYKIFHNPRIEKRNHLTDKYLAVAVLLLVIPSFIILLLWTGTNHYVYMEERQLYNCTNVDVDDSINTYLVMYTCHSSSPWWKGLAVLYNLILSLGLIFLSHMNSQINTHYSQEGEFAARAVFVIFLFLVPCFLIDLIFVARSYYGEVLFCRFAFTVAFPSIILGGLFIPKFIFIRKDRQKKRSTKPSILVTKYEEKQREISELKRTLTARESTISLLRAGYYKPNTNTSSVTSLRNANSLLLSPTSAMSDITFLSDSSDT